MQFFLSICLKKKNTRRFNLVKQFFFLFGLLLTLLDFRADVHSLQHSVVYFTASHADRQRCQQMTEFSS